MKKTTLSLAVALLMGVSVFAANPNDEVNQLALQSFHKAFASAQNVKWEVKQDYVKASFTLDNQVYYAYYNNEGVQTAVVRNLVSDQLPINLLNRLKGDYAGYWISDLFEMVANDQTTYYATIENADKKLVLRSYALDSWSLYSKTKKEAQ